MEDNTLGKAHGCIICPDILLLLLMSRSGMFSLAHVMQIEGPQKLLYGIKLR